MKTHALFVPLLLLPRPGASAEVHFTDITEDAGITFVHENGATGKKYLPETMGSGVAFFDFDGRQGCTLRALLERGARGFGRVFRSLLAVAHFRRLDGENFLRLVDVGVTAFCSSAVQTSGAIL